jgi:hypothetical protein
MPASSSTESPVDFHSLRRTFREAYLLARGCTADDVRQLGHDLHACVIEGSVRGIN